MTFARANVRTNGGRFPKECEGQGQHLTDTPPWRTGFADVFLTGGRRITDMWSDLGGSWNPFVVISIPLTPLFGSTMHVNPLSAERDHAALLNDHCSVFFFPHFFFINSRNITARARFFVPENLDLTIRFQLRNIFLLKTPHIHSEKWEILRLAQYPGQQRCRGSQTKKPCERGCTKVESKLIVNYGFAPISKVINSLITPH